MANNVFANGMEISCKAADGKSVCCFPDVCFTPPQTPATPPGVPIPYPNTAFAKDTTKGSRTVKISGKEVMLRNKSYFKTSTGDEPGCAPKKGIMTGKIKGKAYFIKWSMDVKFEGQNVVRHLDMTTHNHGSNSNTGPWPHIDTESLSDPSNPCIDDLHQEYLACQGYIPYGSHDVCDQLAHRKPSQSKTSIEAEAFGTTAAMNECLAARRCFLQDFDPSGCCDAQTPHHIIEASALAEKSPHNATSANPANFLAGIQGYNVKKAPCVCAEGTSQNVGTHGQFHTFQKESVNRGIANGTIAQEALPLSNDSTIIEYATTYGDAKQNGIEAFKKTFPESKCNTDCLKAQLDGYHKNCGIDDDTKIKAVREGQDDVAAAEATTIERSHTVYLEQQRAARLR
ncbi:MAG: DUF4150 domain-containing protein [Kiloniellales bacterium]|nr:DUF4150 domain-containing protein [Kiloniellales bacterium]